MNRDRTNQRQSRASTPRSTPFGVEATTSTQTCGTITVVSANGSSGGGTSGGGSSGGGSSGGGTSGGGSSGGSIEDETGDETGAGARPSLPYIGELSADNPRALGAGAGLVGLLVLSGR